MFVFAILSKIDMWNSDLPPKDIGNMGETRPLYNIVIISADHIPLKNCNKSGHHLHNDDHHNGGGAHPDNVQREVAESVKDDHHYQHFYKLKITIILMRVLMKILMTIMMMTVLKVLIRAKMPE